jgi:hypothetical protein
MGRTAGRPRHTTHAAIRDTARALFTEHGFDNVSLARIAAAAGARVPEPNRMLAGDLARALMAVASRAIDDWSAQPPEVALDEYVALRIAPLRAAFAALLPA